MKIYLFKIITLLCIIFLLVISARQYFKSNKGTYWQTGGSVTRRVGERFASKGASRRVGNPEGRTRIPEGRTRIPEGRTRIPIKQNFNKSKGELMCKAILEEHYGRPFISIRPSWLKNPIGKHNLEIDCYNEDLKLAVEYSGIQHFKYSPHFHKNKSMFKNQQYRDFFKKMMCEKRGIHLIVVPYTVSHSNIRKYLTQQLEKWDNKI